MSPSKNSVKRFNVSGGRIAASIFQVIVISVLLGIDYFDITQDDHPAWFIIFISGIGLFCLVHFILFISNSLLVFYPEYFYIKSTPYSSPETLPYSDIEEIEHHSSTKVYVRYKKEGSDHKIKLPLKLLSKSNRSQVLKTIKKRAEYFQEQ